MAVTFDPNQHVENPKWTREEFSRAVPMSGLPVGLQRVLTAQKRGHQKAPTKVHDATTPKRRHVKNYVRI